MLLIDGDVLTYALPFTVQEGYGEDADLKDNADIYLEKRLDAFIEKCLEDTKAEDYKIFITSRWDNQDDANFRFKYMQDYKNNRSGMVKPILHYHARDYLLNEHLAVPSSKGLEADDMIAIEHMQLWNRDNEHSIIASIDKDFDQLPGWHYRWEMRRKGKITPSKMYFISEFQGLQNLYKQALTGDKVDNIGYEVKDGKQVKCSYLQGIGEKKAKTLIDHQETEAAMYEACLDIYSNRIEDPKEAEATLQMNLNCLWLVRGFRGKALKLWTAPRRKP